MNDSTRLWRSDEHKMIAGVCGGIADFLGWTPTSVRVLYVLISVCSVAFPGIFAYLILWFVMPRQLNVGRGSPQTGASGSGHSG
ncbi:PspC domain-containing protein [Nevskia ramosa]|uniref:PspC domain-containing protein n=1 Tax=Nevskia ramosa TaxID=64002 RepID=UPI0025E3855A|nr:PspC domain-containing protein [uncultured Nevskia sp.]